MAEPTSEAASNGSSIVQALKIIVPALVAVFALVFFQAEIRRFFTPDEGSTIEVSAGGVSAKRATQSIALVTKEIVIAGMAKGASAEEIADSVERVAAALGRRSEATDPAGRVLWVDDNPTNNTELIDALRAAGLSVETAASNTEALNALASQPYAVLITDLGRDTEVEDGFALVGSARRRGFRAPVMVYTSSEAAAATQNDTRLASTRITSDPAILYEFVLATAGRAPTPRR